MSPLTSGATYPNFSVTVEMEEFDEVSFSFSTQSVPDEKWRVVDRQGHGHFWDCDQLPTLMKVVTGKRWVGDEYDGQEVNITEWQCKLCHETLTPGMKDVPIKRSAPMLKWFLVRIADEEFHVTPEQYADGLAALADHFRGHGRGSVTFEEWERS